MVRLGMLVAQSAEGQAARRLVAERGDCRVDADDEPVDAVPNPAERKKLDIEIEEMEVKKNSSTLCESYPRCRRRRASRKT